MHNDVHTSSLEATLTTALSTIQARSRMILCLIMTHSCSACPLYRVSIRPDPAQFSALGITALSHDAFATGTCCSYVIIIHFSPGADGICLFAMLIYFASANVYMHKMYMSSSVSWWYTTDSSFQGCSEIDYMSICPWRYDYSVNPQWRHQLCCCTGPTPWFGCTPRINIFIWMPHSCQLILIYLLYAHLLPGGCPGPLPLLHAI